MHCRECDSEVPQGSIFNHLRRHHDLTVGQYRDKHGIESQSAHGRGRCWLGKRAPNRKYRNLLTTISCSICSKSFEVDTRWYRFRLKNGHNRFACPSVVSGKRSECFKKLQSIAIKEIRSTEKSRSKTTAQLEKRWRSPAARASFGAAIKAKGPAWHSKRMAAVLKSNLSGRPTRPELVIMRRIASRNMPFRYVGDGSLMIGGLNPDFVSTDGSKRIIEVFGCYWHGCQRCFPGSKSHGIPLNQRLTTFKKHGYSTRVIWEHDL
jgi:hypothetical protein